MRTEYRYFDEGLKTMSNVGIEDWMWVAEYDDGTILKQFDDDGYFHFFKEIDQDQLRLFSMVYTDTEFSLGDTPTFNIQFDPKSMKLIHYYKRTKLAVGAPHELIKTNYCFGWENKQTGEKVIFEITSGGDLIAHNTSNFNATL